MTENYNELYDGYENIQQSSIESMNELQELFFINYAKEKGWNIANLTQEQIDEIRKHNGFNGLILS